MGAYALTNNVGQLDVLDQCFRAKGMAAPRHHSFGNVTLLNYGKINAPSYDNAYHESDRTLIGFGSFFYGGQFATDALPLICRDLDESFAVFGRVGGHFNFVLHQAGATYLVTDKTGVYQCVRYDDGELFYLSNCVLPIATVAPRLSLNKQAILEYINCETSFGGDTVFREITHALPGAVYPIAPLSSPVIHYYNPVDIEADFADVVHAVKDYFAPFRNSPRPILAELSGGRDSRTVVAGLLAVGATPSLTTTAARTGNVEHNLAVAAAKRVGLPIRVRRGASLHVTDESQIDHALDVMELTRNVYRAFTHPQYFDDVSQGGSLLFGGVGAEFLRDHARARLFNDVRGMVEGKYVARTVTMDDATRKSYIDELTVKINRTLDCLGEKDIVRAVAKAHYFEKLRYWCGGRLTRFNQYGFRLKPFMDHLLTRYTFRLPLADRLDGKLQKRIINELCPGLAGTPFLSDAQPFAGTSRTRAVMTLAGSTWDIGRFMFRSSKYGRAVFTRRVSGLLARVGQSEEGPGEFLSACHLNDAYQPRRDAALEAFLGLSPRDILDEHHRGLYFSAFRFIGRFRDKCRWDVVESDVRTGERARSR